MFKEGHRFFTEFFLFEAVNGKSTPIDYVFRSHTRKFLAKLYIKNPATAENYLQKAL
jgi:hypothetical protein